MDQRQKIVEGLKHHAGLADCGCWRVEGDEIKPVCPYYDDKDDGEPACGTKVLMDAIDFFKTQEPIKVHEMILGIDGWGGYCPICGSFLLERHNKHFCGNCGHEVKWNED